MTQDVSPEDVDLENEPWYKFFSEMEFDKAVSGCCLQSDSILYFIACDNIYVPIMPKQSLNLQFAIL